MYIYYYIIYIYASLYIYACLMLLSLQMRHLFLYTDRFAIHILSWLVMCRPRKVMHQLVLVLFGFDLLFSLSLFAGPFVYNTNGGCQVRLRDLQCSVH